MSQTKYSGIDWIGDIPEQWNMISNRHLFQYDGSKVGNNYKDYSLLSLTTNGVREKDINETGGKVPTSYDSYQTVKSGQMIFCLFDLDCSAVFSGLSRFDGMITSAYDVFSCTDLINNSFADYFFQYVFSNRYYKTYSKNVRYTVTGDTFASIKTPVPPYDEQEKISTFLDKKIVQSKNLIDNLNNQIDKLKDYKKALITKCVTKGLDSNVPLKDSGIDWIGEMPKNWTLTELKRHSDIIMGQSPASEDIKEEGTTLFMQGNKDFGQKNPFPSLYCETCNKFSRVGDILLSVRAPVGAINESDKAYGIGRGLCSIKAIQIDRHYLKYYLIKSADDFKYYSNGTTFDEITVDILRNLYLVLPSASEQKYIANYLDKKCSEIDALITSKQSQIDKLNEYQKSLIYEYVTGKKEVS